MRSQTAACAASNSSSVMASPSDLGLEQVQQQQTGRLGFADACAGTQHRGEQLQVFTVLHATQESFGSRDVRRWDVGAHAAALRGLVSLLRRVLPGPLRCQSGERRGQSLQVAAHATGALAARFAMRGTGTCVGSADMP